jgi:hypothetical protein
VASNTLVIRVYDATGQLLAQAPLNADGSYSLSISSGYTGPVLLRISDTDEGDDYIDEFTGKPRDLDGELRSVAVIGSSGIATAHVTPLTELVVRMLGLPAGKNGAEGITLGNISAEQITAVKTKLAQALGLAGIDLTTARPDPIIDANGRIDLSRANAYGRLLAALSGMEAGEGHSTDQMLQTLLASIDLQTGTLSPDGLMDLVSGARLVAKNNPAADALFSGVGKAMGLSAAQIDGIDSAWSTLLTLADGIDNDGAGLSTVQLQALGVRRVEGGAKLDALNNVLDVKTSTVVQSRTKLQAWADTITVVLSKAAGGQATPTQDELEDLGLTDLTPGRTIDLVNKIATSPDDGRDVDSLAKLQALVDVVAPTTSLSALTLGSDTGLSGSDWITREAVQILTARLSAPLLEGEQLLGSVDGGAAWQNISRFVNDTTLIWTGATLVGASTLKLKVIDDALNEGPVTERAYVLDTAPPNLQIIQTNATIAGDGVINAAERTTGVTLSGTAEASRSVSIATGLGSNVSVTGDEAGAWSATLPGVNLPSSGHVNFTITSSDAAGNTATVSRSAAVDTDAPALTVTQSNAQIAGDGVINAAERSAGVVLSGTTEASRSVSIATGLGSNVSIAADEAGAWSATLPGVNLPSSGNVNFTITSSDAAGNTATVTRSAAVDTAAPALIVTQSSAQIAGDGVINAAERSAGVVLSGITEASRSVSIATGLGSNVSVTADEAGAWSATVPSANLSSSGNVNFTITSSDTAGNTATVTRSAAVDTRAPTVAIDPVAQDNTVDAKESAAGVTISGTSTAEDGQTVTVQWGAVSLPAIVVDGLWLVTYRPEDIPGKGTDLVSASVSDQAGNPSSVARRSVTVILDDPNQVALTLNFDPLANNGWINAAQAAAGWTFSGTTNAADGLQVQVSWPERTPLFGSVNNGRWEVTFSPQDLPANGDYLLTASIADAQGNLILLNTQSVAVDITAPDLQVTQTNGDIAGDGILNAAEYATGLQLSGTTEPGLDVIIDGVTQAKATADSAGAWSATVPSLPTSGSVTFTITSNDAAGNTATVTRTATVDTTAPSLTVTQIEGQIAGDGVISAAERTAGLVLSGMTEAGCSVSIATGTGAAVTAKADSAGAWSATLASANLPSSGNVTFTITSSDAAGNTATVTRTAALDTAAPSLIVTQTNDNIAGDGLINAAERTTGVTLSGTTEASRSVSIATGTGSSLSVTADEAGAWSASVPSDSLPESGTVTFTVTSSDAAGNTATVTRSAAVDTSAPTVAIDQVATDDIVDAKERAAGVTISGTSTAEDGQTVNVQWGAVSLPTIVVDGAWSVTYPLEDIPKKGDDSIAASVLDQAGNQSSVAKRSVKVIPDDPNQIVLTLDFDPLANNGWINAEQAKAGWTVSGTTNAADGVQVQVFWPEGASLFASVNSGGWGVTFSPEDLPANGDHFLTASIADAQGNLILLNTRQVAVDMTAPELQVTQTDDDIAGDGILNAAEYATGLQLSGTTEPGLIVSIASASRTEAKAAADGAGAWSATIPAANLPPRGSLSLTITSSDWAGNTAALTRTVTVDTTAPALTITQMEGQIAGDGMINAAERPAGVVLSGMTEAGRSVTLATGTGSDVTVSADGAGAWSATVPAVNLPESGTVTFTVTSSNAVGNTATVIRTATVDTTAPNAPTLTSQHTNAAKPLLVGTAEPGSSIVLTAGSASFSAITGDDGAWQVNTATAQSTGTFNLGDDGTQTVQITSTDAAGNSSNRIASITLDTRAPEAELRLVPHVTLAEPVDGYPMSQILSLPEGEFLVCWVGDAERTIYAQRFDDTGPLAEPVPVTTVDPALQGTIDSLGAVRLGEGMGWAMSWSLYLNDHSDTRSYVQVIANNGQAGDPLLLDAENTRYASDPKIAAVGSSGEFVVVWGALFEPGGQGGFGSYEVYLRRFDDSGQAIAEPPIVLPRHPQVTGNQEKPQVAALGSEGDFVVVWRAGDAGSASSPMSDWSLIAQRFDQDGVAFEEGPLFIEPDPVTDHGEDIPRIAALGTDGAFVLVYESYRINLEGPSQSFMSYVNSAGVVSDALPLLAPGMDGVNAQSPVVSALSDNSFVVAWVLGEFGEQAQQVCVQRFVADQGVITAGPVHKLPALSAYAEAWDLQVLPWGEGFAMSWTTGDGETDRVLVQLFDDQGLPVGGAQQLGVSEAQDAYSPQMAVLTDGERGGDLVLSWVSSFAQVNGPDINKVSVQRLEPERPFGVGVSFSSSADEESVSASWLRLGDTIAITLSFNEELEVTGTPRISLQLGDGEVWANYVSGHGTADLVFSYTVQAGQSDPDGILLGELDLDGGAITDAAGNAAVLPETGAVQLNTGYRVDTQAPIADAGLGMPLELVETIGFLDEMAASTTLLHLLASEDGKQFQALTAVYAQNFFEGSQGFLTQQDFLDMRRLGDEFSGLGLIDIFTSQMSLVFGLGSDAAGLPGGGAITAWQSSEDVDPNGQLTSDLSIYFQFSNSGGFASDWLEGVSSGAPVQDGDDIFPKVAALNSGAVITWIGETAPDVQSVFVQRILSDGDLAPLHGFPVAMRQTDFMIGDQPIYSPAEVTAVGSDGGFVVAWSGADSADPESDNSIFVARFDASGNPVLFNGQPDVVQLEPDNMTDGHDLMPQVVAVGTAGAFAVVWCGQDDEKDYKVFVQLFNDSGAPNGSPIELEEPVSPGFFGEGFVPQAISLGDSGSFAVAWSGFDGEQTKVFVHRLDQNGLAIEAAVMLEDPLRDDAINSNPQLVALGNEGEFAVTWQSLWDLYPDGFGDEQSSAFVQRFDTSGNPVGDSWELQSPEGEGQVSSPKIAALGTNGDFVVGWTDFLLNPRAFVQRFNADGSTGADQTIFSGDDVRVGSSEPGMAYLVKALVNANEDIDSVNDILSLPVDSWKATPIYRADTPTALSTTGLAAGNYRLYTVDAAGQLSAPSDKLVVVRPAPLDLGEVGINVDVNGFVVSGEQEGDNSGSVVSAAGDVNGDGLSDLLITASWANNNLGRSYVVFGKAGTEAVALSGLGSMGFVIDGNPGGNWGDHRLAGVGDVNGDGLDDLIIGSSSSSSDVGDSYVVFGKTDNSNVNLSTLASSAGFVLSATSESAPRVSAAGDVNGDGLADLLIGFPSDLVDAGRSYVVFGKSDSGPVDLTNLGSAGFAINGETSGDRSGDRVSAAGDFNGDGLSDLLIAASGANNWAGKAYVVFGKTDHQAVDLTSGDGGHLVIHGQSGVATEDLTVAAAGDVNGDGLADVIIGAPSDRTSSPGRSYVVFGRTDTSTPINLSSLGSGGFAIESLVPSDISGWSVATAGDLNGDGLSDLLVGAPGWGYTNEDRGHTYVIFGRTSSTTVQLSDIAAGSGGFVIAGQSNGDQSGSSVSAAGDVDGDGLADLIIGAPYAGLEAGKSYVIFGNAVRQLYDTAVDHLGDSDSDDDALSDGGTAKTLVGGAGNDSLAATAASVLYGGAGDDLFVIGPAMIEALQSPMGSDMDRLARVDGGSGIDTLKLDGGTDLTLDMTLIANPAAGAPHSGSRLSSIEIIDLTGAGDNTLRLSAADVLDLVGFNAFEDTGRRQLMIKGDEGDQVERVDSGWQEIERAVVDGIDLDGYAIWEHDVSLATLYLAPNVAFSQVITIVSPPLELA